MAIQKIDDIYELLKGNTQKKRLVVAYANDSHSIEAVNKAVEMGIVEATLCGDENEIKKVCAEHGFDISRFKIVHEPVDTKAAAKAVQMVRDKEADFIMKGLVSTDKYMRAILNKDCGLLPPKATLSHVVVMECPNYHKLLVFSDAAILAKMGERGQLGNIDIDGPLALDVAIDKEAAEIKKIKSPVAGDADCLVFPNIESGNVFYKKNTKLANARQGAILVGATAPSVLSSRGDSVDAKLNSIALAALFAK